MRIWPILFIFTAACGTVTGDPDGPLPDAAPCSDTPMIDVNQPDTSAAIDSQDGRMIARTLSQTFTPTQTGGFGHVRVFLNGCAVSGNPAEVMVQYEIYDDQDNNLFSNTMAFPMDYSDCMNPAFMPTLDDMTGVNLPFTGCITAEAGTTYRLALDTPADEDVQVGINISDPYPNGNLSSESTNGDNNYPSTDMAFQLFLHSDL